MAEARADTGPAEEVYLGDAISFFPDAKRTGGRGEKQIADYRKRLGLLQRWLA